MRTFIAIELEAQIRDNIQAIINHLKKKGGNIRCIKPQGMHLTLNFLGETPHHAVPDIETALKNTMAPYTAFPLRVKGVGVFPPPNQTSQSPVDRYYSKLGTGENKRSCGASIGSSQISPGDSKISSSPDLGKSKII